MKRNGLAGEAREVLSRIGGTTALAGSLHVEVLPFATNQVHAVVLKPDGALERNATVALSVKAADGEMHPLDLAWSDEEARFVGTLEGDAAIRPGPVDVRVTVEDQTHEAHFDAVAVAPAPTYGGQILVAGDVSSEVRVLPEGTVEAVAFGPSGVLTAESDIELNVSLKGSDDALHTVALAWQPEHQTWRGQMDGELRGGPWAPHVPGGARGRYPLGSHCAGRLRRTEPRRGRRRGWRPIRRVGAESGG